MYLFLHKMLNSISMFLCFAWLVSGSFGASAPFIQPCVWNDKACLVKSAQIAVPIFADGIPDLGMPPLDPVKLNSVSIKEGDLNLDFDELTVTGTKNCQVTKLERNKEEKWLRFACECPIDVRGNYVASGKFFSIPIEGNGPMHIQTDKLLINVTHGVNEVDGKDGQKHWQFKIQDQSFEFVTKTLIDFENLFNGDKEKAEPVMIILNQSWKEVLQTFGGPIVREVVNKMESAVDTFLERVPLSELEKD